MGKKAGIQLTADMNLLVKEVRAAAQELRSIHKEAVKAASGLKPLEEGGKRLSGFAKVIDSIKSAFTGLGGKFTAAGIAANLITSGITKLTTGMKNLVGNAINAAGALEELQAKARTFFGDSFSTVERQVTSIATEVGRAKTTILGFATDIAAVFDGAGFSGRALADMSTQIAKLTVNFAELFKVSDETAFGDIQSALVGSSKSLRRYGIDMNDANLKAFALSKGIKASADQMTQGQQVALRYAFIMEKTADAEGQAEKNAEALRNRQKALGEEWKKTLVILGTDASPVWADILGAFNTLLSGTVGLIVELRNQWGAFLSEGFANLGGKKPFASPGSQFANPFATPKQLLGLQPLGGLSSADIGKAFGPAGSTKSINQLEQNPLDPDQILRDAFAKGGAGSGGGAGSSNEVKQEIENFLKARGDMLKQERERLKLRKEMGVITAKEESELQRINGRLMFQDDAIADATAEWREQIQALDAVEEKIKDINKSIADEQKALQKTLTDINKDTKKEKVSTAADLVKELRELRETPNKTAEQENRVREIESFIDPLRQTKEGEEILKEGDEISKIEDPFELIDREKQERIDAAQEESDARVGAFQDELREAERNKAEIQRLEGEKKQIVLTALNERMLQSAIILTAQEERLEQHVNREIELLGKLKNAIMQITGIELSGITSMENQAEEGAVISGRASGSVMRRARGGPVFGPGGPTSDSIPALLSNGEFVINAAATNAFRPLLEKINAMGSPMRFAAGGPVTNNSTKSANITIHNHGRAAEVSANPRRLTWLKRTFLA